MPGKIKTVAVLGNGLAGRTTVEALVSSGAVSVVVVESRKFYEEEYLITYAFGPGGDEHYKTITHDASKVNVPGASYVYGTVISVKAEGDQAGTTKYSVHVSDGTCIEADAVVCATGYTIPLLNPHIGQTAQERAAQVSQYRAAIKSARNVLIAGAGGSAVKLVGDIHAVMDIKGGAKLHLICSGDLVLKAPTGDRDRKAMTEYVRSLEGVELYNDRATHEGFREPCLSRNTYTLKSGRTVEADVYIPSFPVFHAGKYLESIEGAAAADGRVIFNPETFQSKVSPGLFAIGCGDDDSIPTTIPCIERQVPVLAHNVLQHLFSPASPLMLFDRGQMFVHHQSFATCGYGTYSQVNTEGCPSMAQAIVYLCGFPLPCCFGCWLCGCSEGPCGVSCSNGRGKGLSQTLLFLEMSKGGNPVQKFGARHKKQQTVKPSQVSHSADEVEYPDMGVVFGGRDQPAGWSSSLSHAPVLDAPSMSTTMSKSE